MYLNEGFVCTGTVELLDATVRNEVHCGNGMFGGLNAQRLQVGGTLVWLPRGTPKEVDVSFASVKLLRDQPASWPAGTRLVGFTVTGVDDEGMNAKERVTWLENAESYAPDVYRQFVRIYRQSGQSKFSQEVAIANEVDRRKRGNMPWPARSWSWFLQHSVGYGYKMHRPLLFLLGMGALGALFFYLAQANHVMVPVAAHQGAAIDANQCTTDYPCFMPIAYSYELFLPVINLRQLSFWLPSATTGWGKALFVYVWLAIILGWLTTIAIGAGVAQLVNRRD